MGLLSREDLLGKTKRRYREVELPGGDRVRIRSLSEGEKGRYEAWVIGKKRTQMASKELALMRQKLISLCAVDGKGELLFGQGDMEALSEIDAKIAAALYDACNEWVGFEEGDIEKLAKNLDATPADDTT